MSLHFELVGVPTEPVRRTWDSKDALLYALGVGAGTPDPLQELSFTTENSAGVPQQVLPTFGCLLAAARSPRALGDFDVARLVHAEQQAVFHAPLPVEGSVDAVSTVTGIYDKGKAALLVQESVATDVATGERLVTTTSSFFVRGEGGFGGDRGPETPEWAAPEREPDVSVDCPTRPEQSLIYRLSGDRNPLHADPTVAERAGFPRPILHGMCTYGITGRALLRSLAGSDPARLRSMSARFSKPVLPGATLRVDIWAQDGAALFRTTSDDGSVVLDRGTAEYLPD